MRMFCRFLSPSLLAAMAIHASAADWLDPLHAAAHAALLERPEVQRVEYAEKRAQYDLRKQEAQWNPTLTANLNGGQDVQTSNNANEVGTQQEDLFRPLQDYEIARQIAAGRTPTFFTSPNINDFGARQV